MQSEDQEHKAESQRGGSRKEMPDADTQEPVRISGAPDQVSSVACFPGRRAGKVDGGANPKGANNAKPQPRQSGDEKEETYSDMEPRFFVHPGKEPIVDEQCRAYKTDRDGYPECDASGLD